MPNRRSAPRRRTSCSSAPTSSRRAFGARDGRSECRANRAIIVAVAGGEQREPVLDLWPEPQQERTIFLRPDRVSRLLGTAIERSETEQLLSAVGFFVAPKEARLAVQVPGWRPDVTREVDLVEEVARLKGYDAFPDELRPYRPGTVPDAPEEQTRARVRDRLVRAGFLEARTLSLGPPDGPETVAIRNPLSAEEAHLRRRLLPGLIRSRARGGAGSGERVPPRRMDFRCGSTHGRPASAPLV
ncbi:MAG: hypothetical protein DMD67_04330 [Gemmatimonadetes bacterium]|nr:MAG: hypothetical protein DMD67_04330 [Gemmatimonadota bacterium]